MIELAPTSPQVVEEVEKQNTTPSRLTSSLVAKVVTLVLGAASTGASLGTGLSVTPLTPPMASIFPVAPYPRGPRWCMQGGLRAVGDNGWTTKRGI